MIVDLSGYAYPQKTDGVLKKGFVAISCSARRRGRPAALTYPMQGIR
jgi:hypothetical protein